MHRVAAPLLLLLGPILACVAGNPAQCHKVLSEADSRLWGGPPGPHRTPSSGLFGYYHLAEANGGVGLGRGALGNPARSRRSGDLAQATSPPVGQAVSPAKGALAPSSAPKPKLPPDLQHIVDLAGATPPEFDSDALLRVAAVVKVEKGLREQLITRAFHLASAAQFHTPLDLLKQQPDTREAIVAPASRLGLDTLSLQTRAVRLMLDLDKAAARKLFLEIDQPPVNPPSCGDALVPDTAALYEALAAVANNTFTPQERAKEEHINLVMSYMARASSPRQVAPMQHMIAALNVTPDERQELTTRFNGIRQGLLPPAACPDTKADDAGAFWKTETAKRLYEEGVKLRFKKDLQPYSEAERAGEDWGRRLTDYLSALANWTSSEEPDEATWYHEKAIIYEMLIELTPQGQQRDQVTQDFVDFMARSNVQSDRPAEWFYHAQSLVSRMRNASSVDLPKIFAAFENSGNPVLLLYVALAGEKQTT